MTTLDFTEAEPTLANPTAAGKEMFSGNAAIYERLQGRTKKTGIAKYSWVALPVGVVAILGIVAATSTPNRSADNIATGPVDAKPVLTAAATPAAIDATPAADATPAQVHSAITAGPATSQSKPAPVHLARRAAASTDTRPASATRPQSVPAASLTQAPPMAAAPAPAAEAPAPVIAAPAPVLSSPAEAAPAPAQAAPAAAEPAPAAQ
jgi:hypothetical protein